MDKIVGAERQIIKGILTDAEPHVHKQNLRELIDFYLLNCDDVDKTIRQNLYETYRTFAEALDKMDKLNFYGNNPACN